MRLTPNMPNDDDNPGSTEDKASSIVPDFYYELMARIIPGLIAILFFCLWARSHAPSLSHSSGENSSPASPQGNPPTSPGQDAFFSELEKSALYLGGAWTIGIILDNGSFSILQILTSIIMSFKTVPKKSPWSEEKSDLVANPSQTSGLADRLHKLVDKMPQWAFPNLLHEVVKNILRAPSGKEEDDFWTGLEHKPSWKRRDQIKKQAELIFFRCMWEIAILTFLASFFSPPSWAYPFGQSLPILDFKSWGCRFWALVALFIFFVAWYYRRAQFVALWGRMSAALQFRQWGRAS